MENFDLTRSHVCNSLSYPCHRVRGARRNARTITKHVGTSDVGDLPDINRQILHIYELLVIVFS